MLLTGGETEAGEAPGQVLAESVEDPRMLRNTVKNVCLEPVPTTLIPQPESAVWFFPWKTKSASLTFCSLLPNMQVSLEHVSSDPTSVNPVQSFRSS